MVNSKRSQSHVEMIISFVIFIGFLLFIFIFLNPFARTKEPDYIMDNAQKAIINNMTENIGKLSIILNDSGTCYNFSESDYDGNYFEVNDGRKYTIYFSDIFANYETKKEDDCGKGNYTWGVYSREDMVVYEKIQKLKENYEKSNEDYNNLKKSLRITNDFLFKTRDFAGNGIDALSLNKNIPEGINVVSRELPIRVINNSGHIQELVLNIRVW